MTKDVRCTAADFDFFPSDGAALSDDNARIRQVAEAAFERLSFTFTRRHLEHLISAALAPDASANDRYVCACLLKNAAVAARGVFPLCQDTGIATVFGWRNGNAIPATGDGFEALTEGIRHVYDERRLRFSTVCPATFFDEYDPKDNLPAQLALFDGRSALAPLPPFAHRAPADSLSLLFCAKGGGSSNKTTFVSGTKALLTPLAFGAFLREQIAAFGTSACPPYTIAVVTGGLSPEQNLLALKLATCGAYDELTYEPNEHGFRDRALEAEAMRIAAETGYGAQFGGTRYALEAIVIRLPRHGASCPISAGVSCSAHRNLRAVVTREGFWLEKTVTMPETLPRFTEATRFADTAAAETSKGSGEATSNRITETSATPRRIDTDGGIPRVLAQLAGASAGERVILSGNILVARDAAHARWQKLLENGESLPDYCTRYPICYAGPARTPDGAVIGSFGPTTAGRMDGYADALMSRGAALVTLAKGNRSKRWTEACARYGAYYLGTPGGIAALIAREYITAEQVLDYADLGMEAVRLVTVRDLPAFVITTGSGEDFYEKIAHMMSP